jgi:hypothetical protein
MGRYERVSRIPLSGAVTARCLSPTESAKVAYQFRVSRSAVVVRINELRLARVAYASGRKVQVRWQFNSYSERRSWFDVGKISQFPRRWSLVGVIEHRTAKGPPVEIHIEDRWDDTFTAMVLAGRSWSQVPAAKQIS